MAFSTLSHYVTVWRQARYIVLRKQATSACFAAWLSKISFSYNAFSMLVIAHTAFKSVLTWFLSAYFSSDLLVHKCLHRYVVRAKQGSSQSAADSRHRAKSAGAALRRYYLVLFHSEIRNCSFFIIRCKHHLTCTLGTVETDRIFAFASKILLFRHNEDTLKDEIRAVIRGWHSDYLSTVPIVFIRCTASRR